MSLTVFISYSNVDENAANELAGLFDQIGLQYFLDRKDIEWGSHITREIRKGLSECSHVVVVISPASLKSQWVPFEIGHAMGTGKRILPFLTHPSLDLPSYLHDFHHESCLENVERYFRGLLQPADKATEEEGALIDLLKNGFPQQRVEAAHRLGELRSRAAITTLINGLADGIKDARVECIWALRQLGEVAVKPLAQALRSEDSLCRHNAAYTLGRVTGLKFADDPGGVRGAIKWAESHGVFD